MGLSLTCGIYSKDYISFDIGYIGFTHFRIALAEAYNKELGELYKRWIFGSIPYMSEYKELSEEELARLNELSGDLGYLLVHSDTEGNLLPSESRKLYKALENVKCDYTTNKGYHGQEELNVLEELKKMFFYSWKKRRRIIFS